MQDYPIGIPGQEWQAEHYAQWLAAQSIKRHYQADVLERLLALDSDPSNSVFQHKYGDLGIDPKRYPLIGLTSFDASSNKPLALVTGGVHGYETSGVHGALKFVETHWHDYRGAMDLAVAPCVSPWSYETINRWNPNAIDPNRSFTTNGKSEEATMLMQWVKSFDRQPLVHIDLHETTDTDNSEFRPALASRDNVHHPLWEIPDGFYLVGDSENPCHEFQSHIIDAVSRVTHIAPADNDKRIIGEKITQNGVINYPLTALGLCTGFSQATYTTTTEVYPDSPLVNDENCVEAQVTAICSALDFVISRF